MSVLELLKMSLAIFNLLDKCSSEEATIDSVTGVSPAGPCAASAGQQVDCTFPAVFASNFVTVTVTYDVAASVEPVNPLTNTADAADADGNTAMGSGDLAIV